MSDAKPEETPSAEAEPKEKSKPDGEKPKKKVKKTKAKEPKENAEAPPETTAEPPKETPSEPPQDATVVDGQDQPKADVPKENTTNTQPNADILQQNGDTPPQNVDTLPEALKENSIPSEPNGNVQEMSGDVPQGENPPNGDILKADYNVEAPVPMENVVQKGGLKLSFDVVVENVTSGPPKITSSMSIPMDPEQLKLEEQKKMADDDDWLKADDTEAAPEATEVPAEDAPAPVEGGEEAAPAEEEYEEEEEEPPRRRIRSDRPLIFKYWKRPVFLQYAYLYDYRHNYYDDVMDYLDKRQRGITRDIPRAQTWAERALRTYNAKSTRTADFEKRISDINLLSDIRTSNRFYKYHHSKEYFTTKYSQIL